MSFHIDIEEVNQYKKNFIKNKQAVDAGLQTVLERLQVPEQTGSIKGEVASAVKQDLKNVHQGIVNGLKNAYETFDEDYYDVLLEKFRSTVNETNDAAILDEDYLQKEKEHLTNFNKDFQEIIKSYDTQYAKINDLIALSTPHNAFGDKVKEAKKKLTDTLTNVHTFERMQVEKEVVSNMTETYIELLNVSIGLAYSSPDFDALTESSAFSDSMAEYQQAIQAQKQFEAQQRELAEQKRLEEQYAKAHPIETYLKESSEEVAKAWGKAVNYIENLPIDQLVEQYGLPEGFKALGKAEKERILFQMGIIGAAGSLISDTAIGAVSTYNSIENAVDTATLKMAGLKPPKYMEYKMEQDKKALTDTYNLVATEEGRAQLKEGVTKMIGNITQNVKNGDSYAIGGYVFNTATLFVPGAGPAAGVAKMGTTAGKISSSVIKQGKALKAGTISNLNMKGIVYDVNKNTDLLANKPLKLKSTINNISNKVTDKVTNKVTNKVKKVAKVSKDLGKDLSEDISYLVKKSIQLTENAVTPDGEFLAVKKMGSSNKDNHVYFSKTKENISSSQEGKKIKVIQDIFSAPVKISPKEFNDALTNINQSHLVDYFESIIEFSRSGDNKIRFEKMNELLLAIQNANFKGDIELTEEDLNCIRRTMRSLGVEEQYDEALRHGKVISYAKYYEKRVGTERYNNERAPYLAVDDRPHAHHILYKKGKGQAQQSLVKEGQAILKKVDIDPILSLYNLVIAPNRRQHNKENLEAVVVALREADKKGATREEIIEILVKNGEVAKDV